MGMSSSSSSATSCFLVFLIVLNNQTLSSAAQPKMHEFQRKLRQKTAAFSSSAAANSNPPKSIGRVFYPVGYGADPTGVKDSSSAIMAAINEAAATAAGHGLMPGIRDFGGAIIDLLGGNYLISKPITFPSGIGNIVTQGGSLRASNTFPGDKHLIQLIFSPPSPKLTSSSPANFSDQKDSNSDNIRYESITFRDILFDSSLRGGGIAVFDSARIRILDSFFLRFTTQGILVRRGHETFVSRCFLGQHPNDGNDPTEPTFAGTGIDLSGNDNAVTDVVVFSALTGVSISGQANIITGAHCYNKAAGFGGVGIYLFKGSTQNRIVNSYLDYNSIVIEDPDRVLISGGFFLGGGNVRLKAVGGGISGLTIVDNIFSDDRKKNVPCVELDGRFGNNIDQLVVDRNVVKGMKMRSTVGKTVVRGKGKKWKADFSDFLLFPDKINHVSYSFYLKGDQRFPSHAVTNVSGNVVVIESRREVDAVVSVLVDQYNTVGEEKL
ncbi:Pectin lyase-like superfamily protein [Striga hermonthica]|uniref:Pectin lyase-like superfamily protein n=1 Tax=Striga hermonthica TaxID=68872 RepID=A0A9N7N7U7_STRHE|nr:Pectin lyase-like superfamily protein [Striga hermonthica]